MTVNASTKMAFSVSLVHRSRHEDVRSAQYFSPQATLTEATLLRCFAEKSDKAATSRSGQNRVKQLASEHRQ